MSVKTVRVCIRLGELEHARISQCLGHDYDFELSRWIRKACKRYCETIEVHRQKLADEPLYDKIDRPEPAPPTGRRQQIPKRRKAGAP